MAAKRCTREGAWIADCKEKSWKVLLFPLEVGFFQPNRCESCFGRWRWCRQCVVLQYDNKYRQWRSRPAGYGTDEKKRVKPTRILSYTCIRKNEFTPTQCIQNLHYDNKVVNHHCTYTNWRISWSRVETSEESWRPFKDIGTRKRTLQTHVHISYMNALLSFKLLKVKVQRIISHLNIECIIFYFIIL